jgi:hypothetical protein
VVTIPPEVKSHSAAEMWIPNTPQFVAIVIGLVIFIAAVLERIEKPSAFIAIQSALFLVFVLEYLRRKKNNRN